MSQSYQLPTGDDALSTAIETLIPGCLEALRTGFSGATAPANPATYQVWNDTSAMVRKMWTGAAWEVQGPLLQGAEAMLHVDLGDLSASGSKRVFVAPTKFVVSRVILVASTSTTSDGSNNWEFQIHNTTQTEDLRAAVATTDAGAGGAEVVADEGYPISADQNVTIEEGEVLEFQWTLTGAPGALDDAFVVVVGYQRGA